MSDKSLEKGPILETIDRIIEQDTFTIFRLRENNSMYVARHCLPLRVGDQIRISKKEQGTLDGRRVMVINEMIIYNKKGELRYSKEKDYIN